MGNAEQVLHNPLVQSILNARDEKPAISLDVLTKRGMSRSDIVSALRMLEGAGMGKFIVGRHGHPSRFEWAPTTVLRSARIKTPPPAPSQVIPKAKPETDFESEANGARLIRPHTINLRPGLDIFLALPDNLSTEDAVKIARFILSRTV